MDPERDALLQALSHQEAHIAALDEELRVARERLQDLRRNLRALEEAAAASPPPSPSPAPTTAAEKLALFHRLFRGREDVYPKRWENNRKKTNGYSPACRNEWVRGVCDKPRVKCGECPHQAFLPVTDAVILSHLQGRDQGRYVVGVYPLLPDETCYFLAADFDKKSWPEDVSAFAATGREMGVPVAVERSRSGNGAHAWIFFSAPVQASVARRMGCYLLTETMARRHEISMESYDRFFPNQDTMPRGGFGNLIALPLQKAAREHGHTEFLDERLAPHADQWAYLAALERMEPARVEEIAREGSRRGLVIGVRLADDDDEEAPWAPPSVRRSVRASCPLPERIHAVLAQRLFVEKAGLASPALNRIKRLAAFQNPEFYKKQNLRLSTAMTPRVIACAEDHAQYVSLPRGCLEELSVLARDNGSELVVDDQREPGQHLELRFDGTLTEVQQSAAQAMLAHDIGVFVAPPGVGKTVVGTWLVAERACSTLVLVHRQPLADQWIAQLSMFLRIPSGEIGRIGGGKHKPNGRLDVAMIQSLSRNEKAEEWLAGYGHVIVDECHHLPAVTFERVLSQVRARYVTGLTATPKRRDGLHPIGEMQLGPPRFVVHPRDAHRPFALRLVVRETRFRPATQCDFTIQDLYRLLGSDPTRNRMILDDVRAVLAEGRSPIVITERKDHLQILADAMQTGGYHVVVLQGGTTARRRREIAAQIEAIPDGASRVLLAIGRYVGEGFDDARLDTLFLTMPVSWKGTLEQYAGRLHRLHPGKTEVRIHDYVDPEVLMLQRMFEKRLRGYRALGYEWGEPAVEEPEFQWE